MLLGALRRVCLGRLRLGRLRHERGSVLVITAVLMVPMLGFAAFAVDMGNYFQARRQAQAAADAGALAAIQDLPANSSTATTDADAYANKNLTAGPMAGAVVTPTTPYNSNSSEIQVTVSKSVPTIFGKVLGINSETVSASAVAKVNAGATPSAIFAYNSTCSGTGVNLSGNNMNVIGGTHSNGTLTVSGNNETYGATTYGGPNSCGDSVSGNNLTFSGGSPTLDRQNESWPEDYSQNTPACTFSGSSFTWSGNNVTIPTGVYCATGAITISGNNISGIVTLIANSVTLSGNNLNLSPDANNLLVYQKGSGTLSISGNNLNGGTVFAPNATIDLSGNNGTSTGFVEALNVNVSGNNWTFTGNGAAISSSSGSLIQ